MDNRWGHDYLRRQVRVEKTKLIVEKRGHEARLKEIAERLEELAKAEDLLDGE